jgi:hypothetical protein
VCFLRPDDSLLVFETKLPGGIQSTLHQVPEREPSLRLYLYISRGDAVRMSFRAHRRRRRPIYTELDMDQGFPQRRVGDVTGEKAGVELDALGLSEHARAFVVTARARAPILSSLVVRTSRSGLRVTGIASGSSPVYLLGSMSLKNHLRFSWMRVQCSGVVMGGARNIFFCSFAELWMMSLASLESRCWTKRSWTRRFIRLSSVMPSSGCCWVVFASMVEVTWC